MSNGVFEHDVLDQVVHKLDYLGGLAHTVVLADTGFDNRLRQLFDKQGDAVRALDQARAGNALWQ